MKIPATRGVQIHALVLQADMLITVLIQPISKCAKYCLISINFAYNSSFNILYFIFCAAVTGVYIVAAKRTAFGAFGGKLKDITATDLAVYASQAALKAGNVNPQDVSSVVFGNVISVSFV